jgi:hypothetical protein
VEQRTCDNVYFEPKEILLGHTTDIRRIRWMLDTVKRIDRRRLNGVGSSF